MKIKRVIFFIFFLCSFSFGNHKPAKGKLYSAMPILTKDYMGNMMCIYEDYFNIQCKYSVDGGNSWQKAKKYLSKKSSASHPKVFFDKKYGRAICIWENQSYSTSQKTIHASYSIDSGKTWLTNTKPLSNPINKALSPQLIIDKDNIAVCIWEEKISSNSSIIRSSRSINGGVTWKNIVNITNLHSFSKKPKLFLDEKNNKIYCFYLKYFENKYYICSSYSIDSGKNWINSDNYVSEENCNAKDFDIAIDTLGNVYCIYQIQRENSLNKKIVLSTSKNGGRTWHKQKNNISKHKLCSLPSITINKKNDLIALYCETTCNEKKLSSATSKDYGKTWIKDKEKPIGLLSNIYEKVNAKFLDEYTAICLFSSIDDNLDNIITCAYSLDKGLSWHKHKMLLTNKYKANNHPHFIQFNENIVLTAWENQNDEIEDDSYISIKKIIIPKSLEFYGNIEIHSSYIFFTKYVSNLFWKKHKDAKFYRIYRGEISQNHIIYEGKKNCFIDSSTPNDTPFIYYLTYIDKNNEESPSMKIVLYPPE